MGAGWSHEATRVGGWVFVSSALERFFSYSRLDHGRAKQAVYEGGLPHVGLADDADGGVAARAGRRHRRQRRCRRGVCAAAAAEFGDELVVWVELCFSVRPSLGKGKLR